jgi:hypothetical protein
LRPIVTKREAGYDGRERAVRDVQCTRADERVSADGEVVWFWHPDADAKSAGAIPQTTVTKKPGHREEHEGNR